ncbi:MAG: NAD(P)H-dependent glycerol-3-phosphate dehydrogenase [Spirochaetes bacterium]|nr:NAD(P)H-dependent glycerol-3-phosphate dehydrogenase [Spirochaetota bacterium]
MKNKEKLNITVSSSNAAVPGRIAVIGAGAFGTSIARTIARNHPSGRIILWVYEKELVDSINNNHVNNLFLPGIDLPSNISACSEIKDTVKEAEAVIFATPSKVLYEISLRVKKYVPDSASIAYLTKGFCKVHNRILTISETLGRLFPLHKDKITAIYGPSHAEEVSREFHTCLNVASVSGSARKIFVNLIACDYIACRETDDITGVDLGTTLKNPAAIAAGILSVMPKCGDNLAGALITEALAEMVRFGKALGAREETITGIAGLGDLVATALSSHSRNRRFGKDIAKQLLNSGISLGFFDKLIMIIRPEYGFEKISEGINYLAEGIYGIEPILELAEKKKISMPVYRSLYEILLNKKDPALLVETIKDPSKFDEIYKRTRVHVSGKRKGLEKKRGGIFRKTILKNAIENLTDDPVFKLQFEKYRNYFLSGVEGNSEKNYKSAFDKKEYELLKNINESNFEKGLKKLCDFYIRDVSDDFNSFVYKTAVKVLRVLNVLNRIKPGSPGIFKNNIKIYGNPRKIRKVNRHSNIVYASAYKSYLDFLFINMAIDRYSLYIPRFCVDRKIADSPLKSKILKLMGGYFINTERLVNPAYKEVVQAYLSTLVEHGIHILVFPEIEAGKCGAPAEINRELLSRILDALYKNMEEIALIPVEVSHYLKPAEKDSFNGKSILALKNVLNSSVKINFSDPVYVSEFSNSDNIVGMLTEKLKTVWQADAPVYPHYIFCRVIRDNNYVLNIEEAEELISRSLRKYDCTRNRKFKEKKILKKGLDFVLKNKICTVGDSSLSVLKKEEIDYFSNLISNHDLKNAEVIYNTPDSN